MPWRPELPSGGMWALAQGGYGVLVHGRYLCPRAEGGSVPQAERPQHVALQYSTKITKNMCLVGVSCLLTELLVPGVVGPHLLSVQVT